MRSWTSAQEFPGRNKAVVRYPIIGGLSDPTVLRRIQNTLAVKNAFGSTLEEYRQRAWLTDFNYKVNYNKNYLLDITFSQSGMGAYPDTQTKHFLINLRSGKVVKRADAFNSASLATLAVMANQKLKAETKEIIKKAESEKDFDTSARGGVKDQLDQLQFELENLDEFSVSDRGVTFLYNAGFPHVIQAFQTEGRYFFTYSELRPYITRDGPLGIFI